MAVTAPLRANPTTSPTLAELMLAAGIPLTLLLDLAAPGGPDSRAILMSELGPELPGELPLAVADLVRREAAG